ncbi:hypothetical protein [Sphingomonas sp.]|uniref:hypothetical protein n=1 Tax=Sphingomonas sp. TaxID=28214 RepID=UPI0026391CD5|nr:hypothetical protein [Sphingomonas sp.]MDF2604700.1 hypothetical protein [Sphingomonas sp.]
MVDEEELQRRLGILKGKLEEGKITVADHLAAGVKESLSRVRYGADGKVDLATVDGRVRSMAMAVAMMQDREDTKSAASLSEIQHAYFNRIESMFEGAHKLMLAHGGHPQSVSWALSRDAEHVDKNYSLIDPFVSELHEFWKVMSEPVRYHLQDLHLLKGVFGGDLFPSYERNIASSVGLYLDTIVLTDPFMNTRDLFQRWSKDEAVRMFLKHGLQLMNYRALALADTPNPIVAFLPFESAIDDNYRNTLFTAAGTKALAHAGKLFGRQFSDMEELHEFLGRLSDPSDLVERLHDPSRLLFDAEWTGDPETQLRRAINEFSSVSGKHSGEVIFNQCFGRMSQATDVSWKSSSLGGVPIIDATTSWKYYNWSLEYDAQRDLGSQLPLHISRGMQRLAETDMHWLGDIPPESLIEMRKEGALDEIRGMLSSGVDEVVALNPENFFRSADKIYDNLENAFRDHQKKIEELREKKWKFAGHDIGSWVVAGSIEVAAAIFGTPAWGLASAAISQITDAPKLKDIPGKAKDLKNEGERLSKSAAGLLFRHKK